MIVNERKISAVADFCPLFKRLVHSRLLGFEREFFPFVSTTVAPDRPQNRFLKLAFDRAECAVMRQCEPMNRKALSVSAAHFGFRFFRDFRLAENRSNKIVAQLACALIL